MDGVSFEHEGDQCKHLDLLVDVASDDPEYSRLLTVEAKRITAGENDKKIEEILRDYERIQSWRTLDENQLPLFYSVFQSQIVPPRSSPSSFRGTCTPADVAPHWRRFPKPTQGRYCFQRMCNGFKHRCRVNEYSIQTRTYSLTPPSAKQRRLSGQWLM
jgi:hypothetical protein